MTNHDPSTGAAPIADHTGTGFSVLPSLDWQPRTRIVFGSDAVDRVGELAAELGGRRILLVTDPGIVAAGHVARVQRQLAGRCDSVTVYDRVHENPTTADVADCLGVARSATVDLIVGLGGGSSMDTAKGCNFLLTNGGEMKDYWGVGKATRPMLPLIAIPTTAGTGSECQCAALIADAETHQKMACLDPKAAARIAILDPGLTVSQPAAVTAATGIDAITHALETAVSTKRNPVSAIFSREAARLLFAGFPDVVRCPRDLGARGRMLLGAAFAGLAIENSMLGAAHSAANPLTAHHGVVHGQAVGFMLPHVMRFNAGELAVQALYAGLAKALGLGSDGCGDAAAVEALIRAVEGFLDLANVPGSLRDFGLSEAEIPSLASEAAKQWTANFNPRKIAATEFESLYRAGMLPRSNERR